LIIENQKAGDDNHPSGTAERRAKPRTGVPLEASGSGKRSAGHGHGVSTFRKLDAGICGITTAVTEPPPKNYDFKIRVIGGSRSPLCSAWPECLDRIQAIATPPIIAHSTRFSQFVSMTQLAPVGVGVSTIRSSQ
jgi:hypothetical protein